MVIRGSRCKAFFMAAVLCSSAAGCSLFSDEPDYYGYEEEFVIPEPDIIPTTPDDNPGRTVDQMLEMKPRPVHEIKKTDDQEEPVVVAAEEKKSEKTEMYEHSGLFGSKEKISLRRGLNAPASEMVYGEKKRAEIKVVRPLDLKKEMIPDEKAEQAVLDEIVYSSAGVTEKVEAVEETTESGKEEIVAEAVEEKEDASGNMAAAAAEIEVVPAAAEKTAALPETAGGNITVLESSLPAVKTPKASETKIIEVVPAKQKTVQTVGNPVEVVLPAASEHSVGKFLAQQKKTTAAVVPAAELKPAIRVKPDEIPLPLLSQVGENAPEAYAYNEPLVSDEPEGFSLKVPAAPLLDEEVTADNEDASLALIAPAPEEDISESDISVSQNVAVIEFPVGKTALPKSAQKSIKEAVSALKAQSFGRLLVVGYDAPANGNGNIAKAQARAKAVAQALYRAGIPARKVKVTAETIAPYGEETGNYAEIYLEYK